MKIHAVRIYDADGNLKYIVSEEECSKQHWDNFKKFNKKNNPFRLSINENRKDPLDLEEL